MSDYFIIASPGKHPVLHSGESCNYNYSHTHKYQEQTWGHNYTFLRMKGRIWMKSGVRKVTTKSRKSHSAMPPSPRVSMSRKQCKTLCQSWDNCFSKHTIITFRPDKEHILFKLLYSTTLYNQDPSSSSSSIMSPISLFSRGGGLQKPGMKIWNKSTEIRNSIPFNPLSVVADNCRHQGEGLNRRCQQLSNWHFSN